MAPTNKPSEQMVAKLYTNGPAEAGFMGRNEHNQVKCPNGEYRSAQCFMHAAYIRPSETDYYTYSKQPLEDVKKLALRYGFTHFTVNEQTQPKLLRNGN